MPRAEIEPHQEPPSASASEEGQPMPSCHANAKQHWLLGLAIETDNRYMYKNCGPLPNESLDECCCACVTLFLKELMN